MSGSEQDTQRRCFFIAQFSRKNTEARERYDTIIRNALVPACEESGFKLSDMTKGSESTNITHVIWNYLADYELAIADITNFPPNVMYELGARHAMHRPTIAIRDDKIHQNPFDIHDVDTIGYQLNELESLKDKIKEKISSFLLDPTSLIADVLPDLTRTISGERDVFSFLNEEKKINNDKYYALWCFNQRNTNAFKDYYGIEKMAQKGQQDKFRLINTKKVHREYIIDHVKTFKDEIINKKYRIRPTNHKEYAFNLFERRSGGKNYYKTVLLLPATLYGDTIELAVYSENETFYRLLVSKYEKLARFKEDLVLNDGDSDQEIEKKVNEWIDRTK